MTSVLLPLLLAGCTAGPSGKDLPGDSAPDSADTGDTGNPDSTDTQGDSGESAPHSDESGDSGETGAPADHLLLPDLAARNIVYVHVDTLRKDHLPPFGYARDTLPLLSARGWLVVDGIVASSSWTVPSTASLLTGVGPEVHGMRALSRDNPEDFLSIDVPTVTEHLAAQGYATGSFAGNPWVGANSDLHNGFTENLYLPKDTTRPNSEALVEAALDWLDGVDGPFFLFLQPMDPHEPYWVSPRDRGVFGDGSPPFDLEADATTQGQQIYAAMEADEAGATQALVDVYDESLLGLDRSLDALLDALDAAGRLDDTVVILSADHGETLNDAGDRYWGHGESMREELVANPVLILAPGLAPGEARCVGRNEDMFPTLLDAMGLPPLEGVSGVSLRDGCRAQGRASLYTGSDFVGVLAATDGASRVVRYCKGTVEEEAFDLGADPTETSPTDPATLPRGAELQAELDSLAADIQANVGGELCVLP